MQENPIYRVWTRLMSWLRPCVRRQKKNFKYFSSFRDFSGKSRLCHNLWIRMHFKVDDGWNFYLQGFFSGKADSVILLGFEYTINAQNWIKIVVAFLRKSKFLIFFSCELLLNLEVGGKLKIGSRYIQESLIYRIWTRSVDWFRLYDRRRTGRHVHTNYSLALSNP